MEKQRQTREAAGSKMQRELNQEVERAKAELTAYKKRLREEQYKSRYATTDEAKALEQSTFRKLYGLNKTGFSPNTSTVSVSG